MMDDLSTSLSERETLNPPTSSGRNYIAFGSSNRDQMGNVRSEYVTNGNIRENGSRSYGSGNSGSREYSKEYREYKEYNGGRSNYLNNREPIDFDYPNKRRKLTKGYTEDIGLNGMKKTRGFSSMHHHDEWDKLDRIRNPRNGGEVTMSYTMKDRFNNYYMKEKPSRYRPGSSRYPSYDGKPGYENTKVYENGPYPSYKQYHNNVYSQTNHYRDDYKQQLYPPYSPKERNYYPNFNQKRMNLGYNNSNSKYNRMNYRVSDYNSEYSRNNVNFQKNNMEEYEDDDKLMEEEERPPPPITERELTIEMDDLDNQKLLIENEITKLNLEKEKYKEIPVALREPDITKKDKLSPILYNTALVNAIISENHKKLKSSREEAQLTDEKETLKDPISYPCFNENIEKHTILKPKLCKFMAKKKKCMMEIKKEKISKYMEDCKIWKNYLMQLKQKKKPKNIMISSTRRMTRSTRDKSTMYRVDSNERYLSTLAIIPPMRSEMNMFFKDNNRKLRTNQEKRDYLTRTAIWTPEEEEQFIELYKESKKNFDYISRCITNKTRGDCVEFYYKHKFEYEL